MHIIELTDSEREALLEKLEGDYKKVISVRNCSQCPFLGPAMIAASFCMMGDGINVHGSKPPANCPIRPGLRIEITEDI